MVGVKEKKVISKGTGGCLALSFTAVVKKLRDIYNMTTLFPSSPSLHPCPKKKNHLLRQ